MTTMYVATIGGHISELVELADRIPDGDAGPEAGGLWVTNDSAQTRDLLDGRWLITVPMIGERDLVGVTKAIPQARRLILEHGIDRVISTGSAIALAYLPVAAALGIEAHYIESCTRVTTCSKSASILARVPRINRWWQFENPPNRFRHLGSVFDRYQPIDRTEPVALQRVVVTVGTTPRDFRRLIARLVDIVPSTADVLWQTGESDVADLPIEARTLVPERELVAAIDAADLVISHAGAGSLTLALRAGKVPLFIPRRAAYDEQIDDHQVELATWAADHGLAVTADADAITPEHLTEAADRGVVTAPVGELILT
jgi:UDP-N-acetylglucosamine transferase subunit ALG13